MWFFRPHPLGEDFGDHRESSDHGGSDRHAEANLESAQRGGTHVAEALLSDRPRREGAPLSRPEGETFQDDKIGLNVPTSVVCC